MQVQFSMTCPLHIQKKKDFIFLIRGLWKEEGGIYVLNDDVLNDNNIRTFNRVYGKPRIAKCCIIDVFFVRSSHMGTKLIYVHTHTHTHSHTHTGWNLACYLYTW